MSQLEESIMQIVIEVVDSRMASLPQPVDDSEAKETAAKLARINAKEFISINEGAFLLSLSDYQIKKALKQAEEGKSLNPIPVRDLDGVAIVFNREELLQWSKGKKGKTRLRDVSAR